MSKVLNSDILKSRDSISDSSVDFTALLKDSDGLKAFNDFLKKEFSEENLNFWLDCQTFSNLTDVKQIRKQAALIFQKYLDKNAPESVNVDAKARQAAEIKLADPVTNMFDLCQKQVYDLMKSDSFKRFLKSELYMEYLTGKVKMKETPKSKYTRPNLEASFRELRKSIVPWQRKRFKKRFSHPNSSNKSLLDLSNIKPNRKAEFESPIHCQSIPNSSPKTPESSSSQELCPSALLSANTSVISKAELDENKRQDTSITEKASNLSFSDHEKSEAFFSDLMLLSQRLPKNPSLCLPTCLSHPNLLASNSRLSVLIESPVKINSEKLYVNHTFLFKNGSRTGLCCTPEDKSALLGTPVASASSAGSTPAPKILQTSTSLSITTATPTGQAPPPLLPKSVQFKPPARPPGRSKLYVSKAYQV